MYIADERFLFGIFSYIILACVQSAHGGGFSERLTYRMGRIGYRYRWYQDAKLRPQSEKTPYDIEARDYHFKVLFLQEISLTLCSIFLVVRSGGVWIFCLFPLLLLFRLWGVSAIGIGKSKEIRGIYNIPSQVIILKSSRIIDPYVVSIPLVSFLVLSKAIVEKPDHIDSKFVVYHEIGHIHRYDDFIAYSLVSSSFYFAFLVILFVMNEGFFDIFIHLVEELFSSPDVSTIQILLDQILIGFPLAVIVFINSKFVLELWHRREFFADHYSRKMNGNRIVSRLKFIANEIEEKSQPINKLTGLWNELMHPSCSDRILAQTSQVSNLEMISKSNIFRWSLFHLIYFSVLWTGYYVESESIAMLDAWMIIITTLVPYLIYTIMTPYIIRASRTYYDVPEPSLDSVFRGFTLSFMVVSLMCYIGFLDFENPFSLQSLSSFFGLFLALTSWIACVMYVDMWHGYSKTPSRISILLSPLYCGLILVMILGFWDDIAKGNIDNSDLHFIVMWFMILSIHALVVYGVATLVFIITALLYYPYKTGRTFKRK